MPSWAPIDSINPDQQPTIALKIASGGTCIDPRRGTRYPSLMHVQVPATLSPAAVGSSVWDA
jgi:hypothetical protein